MRLTQYQKDVISTLEGTSPNVAIPRTWLPMHLQPVADRMAKRGLIGKGHVDNGSCASREVHFYLDDNGKMT
jgi:hypothetical protein